jgi:hypothetical protein
MYASDELEQVIVAACPNAVALMLFGSLARGEGRVESDVDVLELVRSVKPPYSRGRINFSPYTPEFLSVMARGSSLFVLHLICEGRVLRDPTGELRSALAQYVRPERHDALYAEMGEVLNGLEVLMHAGEEQPAGLMKALMFAVRSVVFARCADAGSPAFDLLTSADLLRDQRLREVEAWRRSGSVSVSGRNLALEVLEYHLGVAGVRVGHDGVASLGAVRRHPAKLVRRMVAQGAGYLGR